MENEPRRGDSVTPHTGFRGSRSCTISIIDSVQFQIIDDKAPSSAPEPSQGCDS